MNGRAPVGTKLIDEPVIPVIHVIHLSHVHPPRERMFSVSWASLTRIEAFIQPRHKARVAAPSSRHPVLPITSRS